MAPEKGVCGLMGFAVAFFALVLLVGPAGEAAEIRILHINDFHGFATGVRPPGSTETVGGAPALSSLTNRLRQEKPSLLVAAGDMIQGSNWTNLFKGRSVIELMNAMRFDASALGNHEFDFGLVALEARILEANFPFLAANVLGVRGVRAFTEFERGGLRIGCIGVVTEETAVATHPKNLSGVTLLPAEQATRTYVDRIRKSVDLVIVLSHLGYHRDLALAKEVAGIDVIVGGHTHTRLNNHVQVGKTIIVQAGEHGKALGVLDLAVEEGRIVSAASRLEDVGVGQREGDPVIAALVDTYERQVDSLLSGVIGEAEVYLDGKNSRTRETNLGNVVADAMRQFARADVAITNGGGIRADIPRGAIRVADVYDALPFDNYVVAVGMKGKELREALEHGVSGLETEDGSFPQVSGLSFVLSGRSPKGARVRDMRVGGRPIDFEETYVVATNDFLAAGGDGYLTFKAIASVPRSGPSQAGPGHSPAIVFRDQGRWLRDIVVEHIATKRRINVAVEGRIVQKD